MLTTLKQNNPRIFLTGILYHRFELRISNVIATYLQVIFFINFYIKHKSHTRYY